MRIEKLGSSVMARRDGECAGRTRWVRIFDSHDCQREMVMITFEEWNTARLATYSHSYKFLPSNLTGDVALER